MEKLTNGQDEINKLRLEGKVEYLNKPEHLQENEKIDKYIEKIKRQNYNPVQLSKYSRTRNISPRI